MIIHWIFLVLILWTVPCTSLTCYNCNCPSFNTSACNCADDIVVEEGAHCTIIEDFDPVNPYLELGSAFLNSSYIWIKDPYYIIVDESIFYNETNGDWQTKTNRVIYGCDWDHCNRFGLISSLPDTFKLTIDSTWLDDNIYGNGSVNGCYNCSDEICGNETDSIVYGQCQYSSCENSTTCSLRDLWHDVDTNELCYQSECTPSNSTDDDDNDEKYKVQVEAIIYLAQNRSDFDIWELNINCAVDNCSRPTIFQEIKQVLQGEISNLTNFPTTRPTTTAPPPTTTTTLPVNPLYCYKCSCIGTSCPCTTTEVASADNAYCSITRLVSGQTTYIDYGHIYTGSTYYYVREYPYVLVGDSIIYDETSGRWNTEPQYVIYGCNVSLCNKPDLLPYLPTSFQMRLSESWLNSSILGTGQPVRNCYECADTVCSESDVLNSTVCPIQPCNTTCLLSDKYEDPTHTEQCYVAYCAPEDDGGFVIDTHRVDIEAILYGSNLESVELWEIDIYCRADNCSRLEIFKELKENLTLHTGDLTFLFNQTVDVPKIRCFDCNCTSDEDCTCDTVSTANAQSNFCTIVRNYDGNNTNIFFNNIEIGSTYTNVREFPFVLVEESILYNNETGQWFTRTNEILYGCNWDYCNTLSLLPSLRSSLQINLPETWLNSNILGAGQPVDNCYECTNSICSLNTTFNSSLCSDGLCNTTCFASNTYVNSTTDEQCFQSFCVPQNSEGSYDTHQVGIKGIVYATQPNVVELWEVYVYCGVDNCSRPEIFQEIEQNFVIGTGNLSLVFNETNIDESDQLRCYSCFCRDDPVCDCNDIVAQPSNESYCTIIRDYDGQHFLIIMEHIDRNSSRVYIRDFPYILVEESILYSDTTGQWTTRPSLVVYGCNTDYCNDPRLIPHLPITFQMSLPETWLNSSVLGTGQPVRDCHECPDAPQCGTTDFLDVGRCPVRSCNTTCFVADTFDNPLTNELCYQSYCLSASYDQDDVNRHRVEIEGIIYANVPNAELELWEIDIYCRADDCSRPEIFKELQEQLTINLGDLSTFNITPALTTPRTSTTTTPATSTTTVSPIQETITCYDCFCYDDPNCACNSYSTANATLNYCTIIRQDYGDAYFMIALEHIGRNSSRVYIRDFPFLLVEESILYNETTKQWYTRTNLVMYGCNWDFCNHPSLVPHIPDSFQMKLNETWLDTNVLGTGQPIRDCHECPDAPQCGPGDFLDVGRCPIDSCNTTCIVSDLYSDPDTNAQCYQSFCAPPDSEFITIDPHRVEMEGILYLEPMGRPVELWEVDVFCRADDCSRPTIFDEIKSIFTTELGDISAFYNVTTPIINTTTTTSLTSTASGSTTSGSTTSGSTTSAGTTSGSTTSAGTTSAGTTISTSSTTQSVPTVSTTSTTQSVPTISTSSTSQIVSTATTTSAGVSTSMIDIILILLFLPISLLYLY